MNKRSDLKNLTDFHYPEQFLKMSGIAMQQQQIADKFINSISKTSPNSSYMEEIRKLSKITENMESSKSFSRILNENTIGLYSSLNFYKNKENIIPKNVLFAMNNYTNTFNMTNNLSIGLKKTKINKLLHTIDKAPIINSIGSNSVSKNYKVPPNVIPQNTLRLMKKSAKLIDIFRPASPLASSILNMEDISHFEALLRSYGSRSRHINLQLQSIYKTPNISSLSKVFKDKRFQSQVSKNLQLSFEESKQLFDQLSHFENISSAEVLNNPDQESNIEQNEQETISKVNKSIPEKTVQDTHNRGDNNYSNKENKHLMSPDSVVIFLYIFISSLSLIFNTIGTFGHTNIQVLISQYLDKAINLITFAYSWSKKD